VIERELGELLREHASRHLVPGAAIGVLREGATVFAYHGITDVASGESVTGETRFGVGSVTKSMVATVVVRLSEAGLLSLDDPVVAHVPELRDTGWGAHATVRDLLANRSGLPLREELEFDFSDRDGADDRALSRFASRIAEAEPTTAVWSYTNAGWALLGRAIETSTGLTWEDAMRRHLLDPTGMTQTVFSTERVVAQRVVGHELAADGPTPVSPLAGRALGPAGTTTSSTVGDMVRFAALHLEDPALAPLRASETDIRIHGWFDAWCHGWARFDWDGRRVWGWDGLVNGERSFLRLVPEQNAAVALMTNGSTGRALYRSLFADLLPAWLGIDMPPLQLEPSVGAAGDLSRFAGVYAWPDRRVDVTASETGLVIDEDGSAKHATPIDDRAFLVDPDDPDNPTVTFDAFDERGRPGALYLMLWGLPRV
jgi:CubicO group peptidase (beta-lactamase class C family)